MKRVVPKHCAEYWKGKGILPEKEANITNYEELGKEWKLLLESIQNAAQKEWGPK
ncbi:hypothetical protein [Alkalihalobacterium alkalinitrilicum]|uniref:hypothetical protein n=1 Tax=Alkalihalobacterium alkalinitrilicum TaxID=427920 RepID=UPI000A7AB924|nr:hypothetical protein [Alkalihalobacterium alkalinitrilicum]